MNKIWGLRRTEAYPAINFLIIFLFFPTHLPPLFVLRAAAGLVLVQQSMMGKFFLDLVRFVLDRSVGWPWLGWARWRGGKGGWSGGTSTVQQLKRTDR